MDNLHITDKTSAPSLSVIEVVPKIRNGLERNGTKRAILFPSFPGLIALKPYNTLP